MDNDFVVDEFWIF